VYEAWVKFSVPQVEGAPADAWHGTVETDPVRFTMREIPVADRRDSPTAEQMAHLEAHVQYFTGDHATPVRPAAVEMPHWLSLKRRLQWAFERTENEGLARYAVALLKKHQLAENDQPYPRWWGKVCILVWRRAYFHQDRFGIGFSAAAWIAHSEQFLQ
jgi:hypothetical protein